MRNIEKLTELADFLDKLPADRFDMRTWGSAYESGVLVYRAPRLNECGTTACIAGWGAVLHATEKELSALHASRASGAFIDFGVSMYGLTNQEAHALFVEPVLKSIHPRHAATVIRYFINTGSVDFSLGELRPASDISRDFAEGRR